MIAGIGQAVELATVFEAHGDTARTGKLNDFLNAGILAALGNDDAVEGAAGLKGFANRVNAGETIHGQIVPSGQFTVHHEVIPAGRGTARNFVSFEAISESLLGLSPGGVIAMLRRSRLRLSDWKLEFHIHFNSYPQGRGEKD